ncbi:hypothetical protein, partial [uncultured Methanobrevibacter sp.]|uniref:hypothetical protein n=1 Tax=uncultured Methanobrevibacter sp. TaxID=253161 RepID=UPI0025DBD703
MNKQILLTVFLVLAVIFSVSAISASDVNVTDSYATSLVDDTSDVSVPMENTTDSSVLSVSGYSNVDNDSSKVSLSSDEVLGSENSNTLSTNTDNNNSLLSSDDGVTALSVSNSVDVYGVGNVSSIEVYKTVTSKVITKYYKGSTPFSANFYDMQGNVLKNTYVKITVSGKTYNRLTDANGVATLPILFKPGTYKVYAYNPVTGYNLTSTFKILKTLRTNDLTKIYTDKKRFYAAFYTSAGKPLVGKYVKFKINGNTYSSKTNSYGIASISLIDLAVGNYKIASYNVDGLYNINNVKVVRTSGSKLIASDYTFLTSGKKVIRVTLHNQYNYAPGEGKTVRFTVNGVNYYGTTNVYGDAYVTLPTSLKNGVYTVKYYFAGNDFYKASSATGSVMVVPSYVPTYTVKSPVNFGSGANTLFKVALTSGSVPLVGQTVTLTVDGSATYVKTTDKYGVVSLPIDLTIGKHVISYSNDAFGGIKAKSGSTTISVNERFDSQLTWKSGTSFNAGSQTYKVLLSTPSGKALPSKLVKLTVNSKTYSATTDSNGYATFNVSLTVGDYTASYAFDGNNGYKPTSGSTKIKSVAPTTMSIANILNSAATVKSYYSTYGKVPSSVTVGGYSYTVPEFLYLMAQAAYQLGNSNTNPVKCIYGVKAPAAPKGDTIDSVELYRSDYLTVAKNLANYIKNHNQAPNYCTSAVGNIIYSEVVDAFSRILTFYKENDKYMPNYCVIKYGTSSDSSASTTVGGLNVRNTITNLAPYKKATTNCQVTNSAIKS